MTFFVETIDEITESKPAPEGEYDLRIVRAERKQSKKSGIDMIELVLAFDDGTDAPPFWHYLLSWDGDTPPDQVRMRKLDGRRFCTCFNVPTDFDPEDLMGATGHAFVGQETRDDGTVQNKMRLPRLKD